MHLDLIATAAGRWADRLTQAGLAYTPRRSPDQPRPDNAPEPDAVVVDAACFADDLAAVCRRTAAGGVPTFLGLSARVPQGAAMAVREGLCGLLVPGEKAAPIPRQIEAALERDCLDADTAVAALTDELDRLAGQFRRQADRSATLQRDLRDAEGVYRSLVDHLPVNILRKDRQCVFTFANAPCCEKFGRRLDELIGCTDYDIFPQELVDKYRRDDLQVMESGAVFEDVERYQEADGRAAYVHVLKAPVRNTSEEVVGIQVVFWDVTERVVAEKGLKASEARARGIFETSLDCMIITDEDGQIIEFNRAAEQTFGYRRDEVIGQVMTDLLFAEADRRRAEDNIDRYAHGREEGSLIGRRLETPLRRKDGSRFIAEMAMQPIPQEDTVHFATVLHDITERKHHEQEIEEARKAAEAASEAKSAFLANMSHEIRTPMNAIIGMTGLVLDTELTPEQREHLTIVQDSAESLLSLINDILDFSKIEAGKLDLDETEFRLRDRLGDTMKSLALRAHGKGLELACHIAPEVPETLVGDAGRLRQVVVNLVGNAIKFTEEGEVVLDVGLVGDAPQPGGSARLRFSVKDTGVGIAEHRKTAIFEAFEQADTSTTRKFGGTGLGLAISSRLVELMGGSVQIDSEVGRGSTFAFEADFAVAEDERPEDRQEIESLRGMRVLIVDDNATNRLILSEIVTSWGMRPQAVAGARAALAVLREAVSLSIPFQLVVTDAQMPEVDGFELVRAIRESEDTGRPTILMLTSGDRPGDSAAAREIGVARFMTKPVKQSELLDAIGASFRVRPSSAKSPSEQDKHRRGLRILLAEDSVPNQKLAVGLLRKFDHEVTIANNGREAIEALAAAGPDGFDVVLMDVQMPEVDGLDATRRIRQSEGEDDRVPIVAMTAHAMKGDAEMCLASGMDAYLSKPIRPEKLFETIDRLLDSQSGVDRASSNPNAPDTSVTGVVNWEAARETVSGDDELLGEVIEAFLEEAPQTLKQLNSAIAFGDGKVVRRAAHTLKGNFRALGCGPASAVAKDVEDAGRDEDMPRAGKLAESLKTELEAVTSELADFLGRG